MATVHLIATRSAVAAAAAAAAACELA